MTVVSMPEILDPAFAGRYGVAAINVVDDLTLEAVLAAAAELESPLIIQTSLKTDHCPDRESGCRSSGLTRSTRIV